MRKKGEPLAMYLLRHEPSGEVINAWLKNFDPDANEGVGYAEWTDDRDEALVFENLEELHAYWTQQSTVRPLRHDGKPNRPLTGFTMEVRPVEKGTGVRWGKNIRRGEK